MFSNLEDYLELLAEVKQEQTTKFNLELNDKVLLKSIARQTSRGVGLTDRQVILVKDKILKYKEQILENSVEFSELSLDLLRLPIRSIDRSKSVFIRSDSTKNDIVIKFPFNKKTIVLVSELAKKYPSFYKHQKGTNEHAFRFFEPIVEDIVDVFLDRNFYIEKEILDFYKEIKKIKNNASNFISVLENNTLLNADARILSIAEKEIGKLSDSTLIKYYDRSLRYGFNKSTQFLSNDFSELASQLANRKTQKAYLPPKKFDIDQIVNALKELDRFPLVVVLDTNNELEQLTKVFNSAKRYVPANQQILLDRIENKNDKNYPVNSFIKENEFSTWLDNNIQIVYIFQERLPKLLLKTEWTPIASLQTSGTRTHSHVSTYLESKCDLMLAIDEQPSMFHRKTNYEIL